MSCDSVCTATVKSLVTLKCCNTGGPPTVVVLVPVFMLWECMSSDSGCTMPVDIMQIGGPEAGES